MKRIKQITKSMFLISSLLLVLLTPTKAYTGSITTPDSGLKTVSPWYTIGFDGSKGHAHQIGDPYYVIRWENEVAFCVDPAIYVGDGTGYSQDYFTRAEREMFSRIVFHGWDLSDKTMWDNVFTQMALYHYTGNIYNPSGIIPDFETHYQNLMNKVNNHETTASFSQQTIEVKVNQPLTLKDTNGVLASSTLIDNGGFEVSLNGNEISILATSNSEHSGTIRFKKYAQLDGDDFVAPLLYSHPTNQSIIKGGKPQPVYFNLNINVNYPGEIEILKVDENNQPISNVEFKISKNKDMSDSITIYTDDTGLANIDELEEGTYYVSEISVKEPFILNKEIIEVIVNQNETTQFTHVNTIAKGQFSIYKTDSKIEDEPLEGAEFEITNSNNEVVGTMVTNLEGIAISPLLPLGTYTFQEIKAPTNYFLDPTVHEVTLSYLDSHTPVVKVLKELVNHKSIKDVSILKVDQNNEPLAGAHLELRDKENQLITSWTSTLEPKLIEDLNIGQSYTLVEVNAPEGYLISDPVEFVVNDSDEVIEIVMINYPIPILKTIAFSQDGLKVVDSNEEVSIVDTINYSGLRANQEYLIKGQLLHKKTLEVLSTNQISFIPTSSEGEIKLEFVFNSSNLKGDDVVIFEDLYFQDELLAQHNDINDTNQTLRVRDEKIKTTASISEFDQDNPSLLTITDVVEYTDLKANHEYTLKGYLMDKTTGLPLLINNQEVRANQTFTPTSTQGSVSLDFIIDLHHLKSKSIVVFEELYDENGLVTEHKDINDTNQTVEFTEIIVKKVDSTNPDKVLENAEFELYFEDLLINKQSSNSEGLLSFFVPKGTYQLKEIKAPGGYKLNQEIIKIDVLSDFEVIEILVQNAPVEEELPSTGSNYNPLIMISGGLLTCCGLLLLKKKKSYT